MSGNDFQSQVNCARPVDGIRSVVTYLIGLETKVVSLLFVYQLKYAPLSAVTSVTSVLGYSTQFTQL